VSPTENEATSRYLADCRSDPELRNVMARTRLPEMFARSYEGLLLPRPLLASERRVRAFADDLAAVFALLVSLPRRLFGGDLEAYCTAAGIDPPLAALMTQGATGNPPLFGRSDAFDDGDSFKLIEFNVGTELGGMEYGELARCLLEAPAFAEFAAEHRLAYTDTAQIVADLLRELAAPVATSDRPNVVLLETTGGIAAHANYRAVAEAMCARGLDFRLGEVQDTELRHGRLELDGIPIDVVLRFYAAGEILGCPRGPEVLEPVLAAAEAGGTVLYTGLENSLFSAKGALALLSDERYREEFTLAERAVIDSVIPWTRPLTRSGELHQLARAERGDLIVKPSVGWGAVGAVLGEAVTDDEWAALLTQRADRGYVLQQVVRPSAERVCDPVTGRVEDWIANWGVFVTPSGYSGAFSRALRPRDGRVITFGNPGTRGATTFTIPDAGFRSELDQAGETS
jgi:hypothetical protein